MANLGPFASALGQSFAGYGNDYQRAQQLALQKQEATARLAQEQAQMQQMAIYREGQARANDALAQDRTDQAAQREQAAALQRSQAQAWLQDGQAALQGDPGAMSRLGAAGISPQQISGYAAELQKTKAPLDTLRQDFRTLAAEFPNDPLVKQGFNPSEPADYAKAYQNNVDIRKLQSAQPKLLQVGDGKGGAIWVPESQAAGMPAPPKAGAANAGAGGAPVMARASQLGLALHGATNILPLMDVLSKQGLPFGEQTLAETAAGKNWAANIPGVKELANAGMNAYDPTYSQYHASLPNFILGATHSISGARINQAQAEQLAQGIELRNSDPPNVRLQKVQNTIDFLNSARAALPPDLVAKQEASLTPAQMNYLRQHGYGKAPSGGALGLIGGVQQDFDPSQAFAGAAPQGVPPGMPAASTTPAPGFSFAHLVPGGGGP